MSFAALFDTDRPTTDPAITETLTELFQQAMLRMNTSGSENEAMVALKMSVKRALAAGLDPYNVVILDTNSQGNLASMQNLVELNRQRVTDRDDIIRQKEVEIDSLRAELKNRSGMEWEDRLLVRAANLWIGGRKKSIDGKSMADIADEIAGETGREITVNMLTQQFYNNPPPKGLKVKVRKNGPTDWLELWEIGASLRNDSTTKRERSWPAALARAMCYADNKLPVKVGGDVNNLDFEKIETLRSKHLLRSGKIRDAKHLVGTAAAEKLVLNAGIIGIDRKALIAKGADYRRLSDLYNRSTIIQISGGKKDSAEDPIRYVHVSFKEHFEKDYEEQRALIEGREASFAESAL